MTRYIVTYRKPSGEVCSTGHTFIDRAQMEADEITKRGWHFLRIVDMEPLKPPTYTPDRRLAR